MERQAYSKNKHKMVRSELTGDKNKKRKKNGLGAHCADCRGRDRRDTVGKRLRLSGSYNAVFKER